MTKIRLGVIPLYKGKYDASKTYGLLNRVKDSNGDLYESAKDDNTGNDLTDTEYWTKLTNFSETNELIGECNKVLDDWNGKTTETVVISLSENHGDSVLGKNIYIRNTDGTVLYTLTWNGTPLTQAIKAGTEYYIDAEELTDHSIPKTETFSAVASYTREVSLVYGSERMKLTLSVYDGTTTEGQTFRVRKGSQYYSYAYKEGVTVEIPFGTAYWVIPDHKVGYNTPYAKQFVASQEERELTMQYTEQFVGIGILTLDGKVTTAADWDNTNTSGVVGILIANSEHAFICYPESRTFALPFGSDGAIEGIDYFTWQNVQGYLGYANTQAYLKAYPNDGNASNAFEYADSKVFLNGNKGYVPSADEARMFKSNYTEVAACYTALGLNIVDRECQTSTPSDDNRVLFVHNSGLEYTGSRGGTFRVLVVSPF